MKKKNIFIQVRSELGAGTRGASLGPDAIKLASVQQNDDFFFNKKIINIPDKNEFLFKKDNFKFAKRINYIYDEFNIIAKEFNFKLNKDERAIILSGDHSSAAAIISVIKNNFSNKKMGVIWIDAHADLHSPYTTPSGNVHGMPLSILLNEDNKEKRKNDPCEKTIKYWNKIKNFQGFTPKIFYDDLLFIGLRSFEPEEKYLIKKNNVSVITVKEIREEGFENIFYKINKKFNAYDLLYVSFDVDSLDSSLSKGTGTPEQDGFLLDEVIKLLSFLLNKEENYFFEITEVNPLLDSENKMAKIVFEILKKTLK